MVLQGDVQEGHNSPNSKYGPRGEAHVSLPLRAVLILSLLGVTALAGCYGPTPAEPDAGASLPSLVRHVVLRLTEADLAAPAPSPELQLARASVIFDYKHEGDTIDLAKVKIRYVTVDGVQSTATFAGLSDKASLGDGETVVFQLPDDASTLSFVRLEKDDVPFASRDGSRTEWLTAGDMPLPLAVKGVGNTTYSLLAFSSVDLRGDGLEFAETGNFTCPPTGCLSNDRTTRITKIALATNSTLQASLQLQSSIEQRQRRVTFEVLRSNVTTNLDFTLDADFGNVSLDVGIRGRTVESSTGKVDMTFDKEGEITAFGSQGDSTTRRNYTLRRGVPEEFTSMFTEGATTTQQPYDQRPVDLVGTGDATIVSFLQRLWALDVRPGDTYSIHLDHAVARLNYTSSIGPLESRPIGDRERDVYKVTDRLQVSLKNVTVPREYEYSAEAFIDTTTFLPVYIQATVSQRIRAIDYPEIRDAVERNLTQAGDRLVRWMDNGVITVTTRVFLSMGHDDGNVTHAAILEGGASRLLPMLAAMSMGRAIGPFIPGGRPDIPEIVFIAKEDEDRIVVQAAQSAEWNRVGLFVQSCTAAAHVTVDVGNVVAPHQNRPADDIETHAPVSTPGCASPLQPLDVSLTRTPVFAADYLALCAEGGPATDVEVVLVDVPTNYAMQTVSFRDIDACV